jgi:hypothetical protein
MSARKELRRDIDTGCEASKVLPPRPNADKADWDSETGKMGGVKLGPARSGGNEPPEGLLSRAWFKCCERIAAEEPLGALLETKGVEG